MRRTTVILLVLAACDNKHDVQAAPSAAPSLPAPLEARSSFSPSPAIARPERPIPLPGHMVRSNVPIETQQKAIAYMVAMRAPRPDEPNAEPAYAANLVGKLKPISLSLDTGADKPRLNRTEIVANGRQIVQLMADGRDERLANRALVQKAGVTFATLALQRRAHAMPARHP